MEIPRLDLLRSLLRFTWSEAAARSDASSHPKRPACSTACAPHGTVATTALHSPKELGPRRVERPPETGVRPPGRARSSTCDGRRCRAHTTAKARRVATQSHGVGSTLARNCAEGSSARRRQRSVLPSHSRLCASLSPSVWHGSDGLRARRTAGAADLRVRLSDVACRQSRVRPPGEV